MKYLNRLIILGITAGMFACVELDLEPNSAIPAEDAFQDRKTVNAVLNGIYDALQSNSIVQDYTLFADLAADNLVTVGSKIEYREVYNNRITAFNVDVEGIWNSHYDLINRANQLIANLSGNPNFGQDYIDLVVGQARFLRSLAHFNLARMFGAIPYRTDPSLGISPDEINAPRISQEQVYDLVLQDLTAAEQELEGIGRGSGPFQASEATVKAMMARVYLYTDDFPNAAAKANEVINLTYDLVGGENYGTLYQESTGTPEVIFAVDFVNDQARNELGNYTQPSGRFEVALRKQAFEMFAADDARKQASVAQSGNVFFLNKYTDVNNQSDNLIVLRLAEMYLIRAEALNEIGYQADGQAFELLNTIRTRAGLDALDAGDLPNQSAFQLAIEEERRRELIGEGHRWFDLIRNGRALQVLNSKGTISNENQLLFPIPQSEIDTNRHPEMVQNSGY